MNHRLLGTAAARPTDTDALRAAAPASLEAPANTAPRDALLQVQGVTLDYTRGAQVLRAAQRVSFELAAGERLVLLGPSGCGKSTLLKAVAGFLRPTEGRILLDGQPVQGPGPERLVVFQEFDQLAPWLTVLGNVVFPLRVTGRAGREQARERAHQVLRQVGLERFAQAYPQTLSGGMKQRVAIARALVMQPRVLLMDEPFAALDALTRRRMQQELLQLADAVGFTLLFVTHSIEEALVVADRIVLLSPHPGRVRAELDAQGFGLDSGGSAAFQAQVQRIQALLFDGQPVAA